MCLGRPEAAQNKPPFPGGMKPDRQLVSRTNTRFKLPFLSRLFFHDFRATWNPHGYWLGVVCTEDTSKDVSRFLGGMTSSRFDHCGNLFFPVNHSIERSLP